MEIYARELIPRLAAPRRPRRRDRVRQPRGRGGRRRPVGRRRADGGRAGARAATACEWVRGEQQHLPARWPTRAGCDVVHRLGLDRAAARAASRASRRSTTSTTSSSPTRTSALRGLGMRRARAGRRAALAPRDRRRRSRRATTSSSTCARRPAKIDVVPLAAPRRPAAAPRPPRRSCARASGSATGRSCSARQRQAPAQEPRAAARRARPASRPSGGPVLVVPGYPTPHEAELRATGRGAGRRRATSSGRPGSPAQDLEGLYALATLVVFPSLLRGLRPAGARGDGARRARRLLGPLVAARGRGRRGAALRPRGRRRDPRGDRARCWPTPADARAPGRAAGASGPRGFTWERTAELTAAAYERALSQRA